jgi:N-acetylglucosaminyldiphosphoundecaprenol N-acetyl-beta-D-mannosaminyltransferase
MSLDAEKILGISVTISPKNDILEEIQKYLNNSSENTTKPLVIVTPNSEQMVLAQSEPHFAKVLNKADVALPDGRGIVWAAKKFQIPNSNFQITRIAGVEFMEDLVRLSAEFGVGIGLIGGRENVAVDAFECLRQKYPGIGGWGENGPEALVYGSALAIPDEDGYFLGLIGRLREAKTRMLFIGMGAPKQEYFIEALLKRLPADSQPMVLMSVGGSFDMISGRIKRAPIPVGNFGLEWLWRLVQQPWRWRRQLSLFKYMYLVIRADKKKAYPSDSPGI